MRTVLFLLLISIPSVVFAQQEFNLGDQIEGNWKGNGTWYKGKIAEYKDGKYFINYNDGDKEWTTADFIRRTGEISWPENTCADKKSYFKKGDQIDILEGTVWYDGTVISENGYGQYYVHYDGWSDAYDLVVCNGRVRARSKKEKSTAPTGNTYNSNNSGNHIEISLVNSCRFEITFVVDDHEYEVSANRTVNVNVPAGTEIYCYNSKRMKVLKGRASTTMATFFSICN